MANVNSSLVVFALGVALAACNTTSKKTIDTEAACTVATMKLQLAVASIKQCGSEINCWVQPSDYQQMYLEAFKTELYCK